MMDSCAVTYEMSKYDVSLGTFVLVHYGLGMESIYMLGSEE